MKRASYREAIQWIADNDDPAEDDPDTIADQISVVLIADIFGVDSKKVAFDVINRRSDRRP